MSSIVVQIIDENNSTNLSDNLLSSNTIIDDENDDETMLHILTDQFQSLNHINGNVHSGAPIVIWFGHQDSSLRNALIAYLTVEDITLILFSNENHLWEWLDSNSSQTVASLVLQPIEHSRELINQSHNYVCVRSILVRSQNHDYAVLQSFSRSYSKVDGVFQDDTRLLIKLISDLILFSEELGDINRDSEIERNYDRATKLCVLIQKL